MCIIYTKDEKMLDYELLECWTCNPEALSLSPTLNYFRTLIAGHLHVIESGCLMEVQFCNVFPIESKSC